MNKCVYKDKVISAEDFAANFETETELRKNVKELYCCDPDCQSPVIFRHGVKRVAHFAHKAGNIHCNYSAYTDKMPAVVKQVQLELVTQLQKAALQTNGAYTVDFDVRLCSTNKHISNIVLNGTVKYVIDIMQSNKTVKYLDTLYDLYRSMGFIPFPVIIADVRGNFSDTAINETWFNTLYTKFAYVDNDPQNSRKLIEIPIEKVIVPKSKRWLGQLTSDDIINDVLAAFGGDVRAVRKLINVLRMPNLNEYDTFVKICNYIAEIPLNNMFVVINRILHQICEQIGE